MVKNLPAKAEEVGSILESGRSPEGEMATHSSILAWEILRQSLVVYSPWGHRGIRHDLVIEQQQGKYCSLN